MAKCIRLSLASIFDDDIKVQKIETLPAIRPIKFCLCFLLFRSNRLERIAKSLRQPSSMAMSESNTSVISPGRSDNGNIDAYSSPTNSNSNGGFYG